MEYHSLRDYRIPHQAYTDPNMIRKKGTSYPLDASLEESERGYKLCKNKVECLRTQATLMRHKFLHKIAAEGDEK